MLLEIPYKTRHKGSNTFENAMKQGFGKYWLEFSFQENNGL